MAQNRRDFVKTTGLLTMVPIAALAQVAPQSAGETQSVRSNMASKRPFDYSQARKWAPRADARDFSTIFPELPGVIPQADLQNLASKEMDEWMAKTRKSEILQARARKHMPWGVLGCYQKDWETPHLLYAKKSMGTRIWDVDGIEYIDLSYGDTPDMFGHGPGNPAVAACAKRMLEDGLSTMMGNEDAAVAAELLAARFGQPFWMHSLSATDANRAVFAIARHHTSRPNIAIPNLTYFGTLDETQKFMPEPGVISRFHNLGIYHGKVDQGTKIFNWNDLESLEEILSDRSVAVVLMEAVLSNFGWVWPRDGWHQGVRELCDKYGTLLCYDETHTISQGPKGMVGSMGLAGDFWTCGKAISSGIPGAVYGMSEEIAKKLHKDHSAVGFLSGGGLGFLGTSLCGNTMSTLALRVTLEQIFTEKFFSGIYANASYLVSEMERVIRKYAAPFRVESMGNRVCYHFMPDQAHGLMAGLVQIGFGGLFELSHAYLWNHGLLIMPYFNMVLISPEHTRRDTDQFIVAWDEIVRFMMGK